MPRQLAEPTSTHYRGNVVAMVIAKSRITAQGQISVPAEVRRKLGVGPGSALDWEEEDGRMFIRRAGKYTFEEIHKVLFPSGPPPRMSIAQMDEAIRAHVRRRHARR